MCVRESGEEGSGMKTMRLQRKAVRGSGHIIAALSSQKSFLFEKEKIQRKGRWDKERGKR